MAGVLRLGRWEVEAYGEGGIDGLGLLLFGGQGVRAEGAREVEQVIERLGAVGVHLGVAQWVARQVGVMEGVGVQVGVRGGQRDEGAVGVEEALWRGGEGVALTYGGKVGLGGWRPAFRYIDINGWAAATGVSRPDLELTIRLTVWRLLLEGDVNAVILDVSGRTLERDDLEALTPPVDATRDRVQRTLKALSEKLLSLFIRADEGDVQGDASSRAEGTLTGSIQALIRATPYPDEGGEGAQQLAKRATELRVQHWLDALPPRLAANPLLLSSLSSLEAHLDATHLQHLIATLQTLDATLSPAQASESIGRLLKLNPSLNPNNPSWTWLTQWWSDLADPLDGGAAALLWRAPLSLLNTPSSLPLRALALLTPSSLFDAFDPPDTQSHRTLSLCQALIERSDPSLGWLLLRQLSDTDSPPLHLITSLRAILRSAYANPSWAPPPPDDPLRDGFLLPPNAAVSPPSTAWSTAQLSRILFDALLGAALEAHLGSHTDAGERTFRARVSPGLAYLNHMPDAVSLPKPTPRHKPRGNEGPNLATASLFLIALFALITLIGWALLSIRR